MSDEFDYFASGREYLATGREPLIFWLLEPHGEHTIVFTKLWFWILPDFVGYAHYEFYILPSSKPASPQTRAMNSGGTAAHP